MPNYEIKQEVKDLILPMVANKVKPKRILNILKSYKNQGRLNENEIPSVNKIADLKRNFSKKDIFIGTEGEFLQLIRRLSYENRSDDSGAIIIGQNLDPENFCLVFTSPCLLKNVIQQFLNGPIKYLLGRNL